VEEKQGLTTVAEIVRRSLASKVTFQFSGWVKRVEYICALIRKALVLY